MATSVSSVSTASVSSYTGTTASSSTTSSSDTSTQLEQLKARLDLTVVHVLSNPPPGWTGEQGRITADLFKRHLPPNYDAHEYFICGPDPMMDAIETALDALQVPRSKYHSERYSFV